jgi:hypothetical protein
MALAALIVAAIVDVALVLLIFGAPGSLVTWPDGMSADTFMSSLTALTVFCLIAPIAGFALRSFNRPVGGILVAWLPPVAVLFVAALPAA